MSLTHLSPSVPLSPANVGQYREATLLHGSPALVHFSAPSLPPDLQESLPSLSILGRALCRDTRITTFFQAVRVKGEGHEIRIVR